MLHPHRPSRPAPDNLPPAPRWSLRAACRGIEDPDVFFPDGDAVLIEEAKGYCRGCPVRPECLIDAMDRGEAHGVWGGLDASERHPQHVRRRQITPSAKKRNTKPVGGAGGRPAAA
ncbi:WhiB family transcriptional regulator [Streptomyces diacarni]|uniref:WhiB family transcriptional regulator n=1 Tax=Streptomyces diacarni TaxID=2800381 RepID=UPI0033D80739